MKYLHPVATVPNALIDDTKLHYTTKRVALALLLMAGRKRVTVSVTFAELARFAHCSPATAQQAVTELISAGYMMKTRRYRYGKDQNHLIYDANGYQWIARIGGYTLVRRELLDYELTPAAFANLLYIYRCAGRQGRAFPSLRRIAGLLVNAAKTGLDMAKSTVCLALKLLRHLQAVVRLRCCKLDGSYSANSYYLTDMVISDGRRATESTPEEISLVGGSPIFSKPSIINQITEDFTLREEKYGVAQFGIFANFYGDPEPEVRFDGTGWIVLVSADDEQELTA